jgi:hypothetical protein
MKLNIYVARFESTVMIRILEQDENLRSSGAIAQVSSNKYVKYLASQGTPELSISSGVLYVRGSSKNNDSWGLTRDCDGIDKADTICRDIVRLWAKCNGINAPVIDVTDTAGNPYEVVVNEKPGTSGGALVYTYSEVI